MRNGRGRLLQTLTVTIITRRCSDQTRDLILPFLFRTKFTLAALGYQMLRRDVSTFLSSELHP